MGIDMGMYKLKPYCKSEIWGGRKLAEQYGKSGYEKIAESWELSGYEGKESKVVGGKYNGNTINEVIKKEGKQILGSKCESHKGIPLLIKFIDAERALSVQVHPDDNMAAEVGADGGKTEMWIVCEADEGAYIYFGLNRKVTESEYRAAISNGTVTEYLNKIYVKKGDTFFIKAGTVHAIGAGITICEIQQTSDTTYRLYDYNRLGVDGRPRDLHIDLGVRASNLVPPSYFYETGKRVGVELKLVSSEYFNVSKYELNGEAYETFVVGEDSFAALTVTDGDGSVHSCGESMSVRKGDSIFVSAGSGEVKIEGNMVVVKSTL